MSVGFPTAREFDLKLHKEDLSCYRLFPHGGYDIAPITSPAFIIAAAVIAILFTANVVSSPIAAGVAGPLGSVGVLLSPIAAWKIYSYYQYRNAPLTKAKIEEKLKWSNIRAEVRDFDLYIPAKEIIANLANQYKIVLNKEN